MKSHLNTITWILRIVAALIMLQTLFFKFSAAPESVYIFTKLGIEPWGRIGIGCIELVASILLLIPRFTFIGAFLTVGISAGAIFSHLTQLGIVVQDDGGELFILACILFITSLTLLVILRKKFYSILLKPGYQKR